MTVLEMSDKELTKKLKDEQYSFAILGPLSQMFMLYQRQAEILVALHELSRKTK